MRALVNEPGPGHWVEALLLVAAKYSNDLIVLLSNLPVTVAMLTYIEP